MPSSGAARMVRFSASTPARCPAARGRPRAAAQRPLPSMISATWRGPSGSELGVWAAMRVILRQIAPSDLHDLDFLGLQGLVDALDGGVGVLLDLGLHL